MKRYYVIAEGRVQGVGFRWFCTMNAQQLGLTGTVRNMSNGMVEIYVQGHPAKIEVFFDILRKGDRFIRVDQLTSKEIKVDPNESTFRSIY